MSGYPTNDWETVFSAPDSAASLWKQLAPSIDSEILEKTLERLRHAADPDLALATWARWLQVETSQTTATAAGGEESTARRQRWRSSSFRRGFIALAGVSRAMGERLLDLWKDFSPARWRERGWETTASLRLRLDRLLPKDPTAAEIPDILRRFQQIETLRIAYLDCVEGLQVDLITMQISELADATVGAALEVAQRAVARRYGLPAAVEGFAVFAMGKLGGAELNYSSDIDLAFFYDENCSLDRGDGRRLEGRMELEPFFTRVAERLSQLISEFTQRGRLYRLDLRLRPMGSASGIVTTVRGAVDTYYRTGRAWERQALIRLRLIAGDRRVGERLHRELDAFVFSATLTAEDIAEIRSLKAQMEQLAVAKDPDAVEIKRGSGGIRDVEYIVQYLQLLYGSRHPELKAPNIFAALEALDSLEFFELEETDVLRQGYRFARQVEHRVQLDNMRQVHRLPADPAELRRLARGLGFDTVEAFEAARKHHATNVRRVYRLLFDEATVVRAEEAELPALLELPVEAGIDAGVRLLEPYGFREPAEAFRRLRSLAVGTGRTLDAHRAQEVFGSVVRKLLREFSRHADPDRALMHFEECVATLGARSVFYQLLDESERALHLFVMLASRSSYVVRILRARPELFDEVIDVLLTGESFSRAVLLDEVARFPREPETFVAEAFSFKHLHWVLTAIRDSEQKCNLSAVMRTVSDISEAIVSGLFTVALEDSERRWGGWEKRPRFTVLALGKLGGREMNYRSDVDLVVLYERAGTNRAGMGAQEFFEKAAQRFLRLTSEKDSVGVLLEVDLRLRPLGGHNSVAVSVEAWQQYFEVGAGQNWERQAFLRARPICGDGELGAEVLDFVYRELVVGGKAGPESAEALRADAAAMRRKLEDSVPAGHLKRGRGGVMDVEFIVQVEQLCHGRAKPEILTPNTAEALMALRSAGILSEAEGSHLLTAYQFLRQLESRLALVGEPGQSISVPRKISDTELESLVQKMAYKGSGEESALAIFRSELEFYTRENRKIFEERVGRV